MKFCSASFSQNILKIFTEYFELLIQIKSMNAIFGIKMQVTVGEQVIIGVMVS